MISFTLVEVPPQSASPGPTKPSWGLKKSPASWDGRQGGRCAEKRLFALFRDAGSTHAFIDAFASADIHEVVAARASVEAAYCEARLQRQSCLGRSTCLIDLAQTR